jgi:hypothetical protein
MTTQTIEHPQATPSASQPQRTINLILGGKGGTGKTLFARLLYYALVTTGVKTVGIDSDTENPEFVIFHADTSKYGVMALNFGNLSESKKIISVLGGQYQNDEMPYLMAQMPADAIVIDMPAASGKDCRAQFDTLNFIKNCQRWGYQATIITVLNTGTSAIQSLAAMMEHCGSDVNYVAVKSLFWKYSEEGFIRWDNSAARKKFKKFKGKEIEMPVLPPTTFDALQESHLSFFDLDSMDLGDQILAESFLDRGLFQINQLASVVGLPATTAEA